MSSPLVYTIDFCQIDFPKTQLFIQGSLWQIFFTRQTLNVLAMTSHTLNPADVIFYYSPII